MIQKEAGKEDVNLYEKVEKELKENGWIRQPKQFCEDFTMNNVMNRCL